MRTNHLQILQEFLHDKQHPENIPDKGFPFVTISRQTGAGAHLLSQVLLVDFMKEKSDLFRGWHVFDRLLVEVIAEDPTLRDSIEGLAREYHKSEFQEFIEGIIAGGTSQYSLHKRTFRVIGMLAAIGKVIIVGRAGCCVTRELIGGVHIRLVAPHATRIKNTIRELGVPEEEAERIMARQDNDRRKIMKTFFSRDIDDPLLYDTVWNTEKTNMHDITSSVIQLIKRRADAGR